MKNFLLTFITTLCATSIVNVALAQCVITAVPDPTVGYTPTQIVNGSFDEEPWMVFTYQGVTYYSCPDNRNFDTTNKDNEEGYAQNVVFNGVDGGWNTTDRTIWRGSLFEITNTNSGTHDYRHNSSIQGTDKYVEMNNYHACMLYQDLTTYSHDVIRWTLKHAVTTAGNEYQPIRVEIGAPNRDGSGNIINASGWASNLNPQIDLATKAIYRYNGVTDKDGNTSNLGFGSAIDLQYLRLHNTSADQQNGWWTAQGIYLIPEGQTVTRFGFISEAEKQNQGNLLDDLTFTTIIGGLTASYGENGSIVVCGFWGEDDASKHLIIDINNIPHEVDMTAVSGQHFTLTVPEECIDGNVSSISVYHEDYPGAESSIVVNQPMSVTAEDVHTVYDGVTSWGISVVVNEPTTGYTLTYGTSYNDCNDAVSPTFMLPGTHYAYYTVTAPGYTTEKRKVAVVIDRAPFPSDVTITPPTGIEGLMYDKTDQTLITAGSATGGYNMVYTLGSDDNTPPTGIWSNVLPKGREWGDYYVWYKVVGDDLHNDSEPQCIIVNIAEPAIRTVTLGVEPAGMGNIYMPSIVYSEDFESGVWTLPSGWTNDASYPWTVVDKDGNHCLKSTNNGHDGTDASISVAVSLPYGGIISFRGKVSSENNFDWGWFFIDGTRKLNISGNVDQNCTYEIAAGNHTLRWTYHKDGSVSNGDDEFFIDDIVIQEWSPASTNSVLVSNGDDVNLKVVPVDDVMYHLNNWTDGTDNILGTNPLLNLKVTSDISATAHFTQSHATLQVTSNNESMGNVTFDTNAPAAEEHFTIYDGTEHPQELIWESPIFFGYLDMHAESQHIIPAAKLATINGQTISSITYYIDGDNSFTTDVQVDMYVKEVDFTTLGDLVDKNSCMHVYSGYLTSVSKGSYSEMTITLNTPYTYNGGNLLIGFDNLNNGTSMYYIGFLGEDVEPGVAMTFNYTYDWDIHSSALPKTTFTYSTGSLPENPAGGYYIPLGEEVTITATPTSDAYGFVNWTINDVPVSTSNPFDYTVTESVNIVGNFVPTVTVTYDGNGNEAGEVPTDATIYLTGQSVTTLDALSPLLKTGYLFAGWRNSVDGNVYAVGESFTITANTTLAAEWNVDMNITLIDNETAMPTILSALNDGNARNITINRSLSRDGNYSTLCLPFDLDAAGIASSSLNGFVVCELTDMWSVGNELRLLMTQTSTIVAGNPYLVRYNLTPTDPVNPLVFNDVTITREEGLSTSANGATMYGILEPTLLEQNNENVLFLAANNTLKWNGTGSNLLAFRAYFVITGGPSMAPVQKGMSARIVEQRETPTDLESCQSLEVSIQKVIRDGQLIIIRGDKEFNAQGQILK